MRFVPGDWYDTACLKLTGVTLPDGSGGFKRADRSGNGLVVEVLEIAHV
jgi:hypothetical protein